MVGQAKRAQHVVSQKSKAVSEMLEQDAVQSAKKHKETEPMKGKLENENLRPTKSR